MSNKQIWVSPGGKDSDWKNLWRVHKPDADRDIKVIHWNKTEAINVAQQIARNQWLDTKIQNLNGQISWWNSYWNDPCPPKDTRP
jgi:hypothetical protein